VVEGQVVPPKTATFIPATVYDNKILLKNDPGYVATLHSLDYVERERLLGNNWKIRYTSGSMFKEEWYANRYVEPDDPRLKRLETVYRAWDTAATPVTDSQGNVVAFEDAPKNKPNDPDWTVGVKMGVITSSEPYRENGIERKRLRRDYFILDVVRFRGTPLGVEETIRATALKDGRGVKIYMEQEPGASGVQIISHYKRNVLNGFVLEGVRPTGPKITRAKALSADSEHGYIWIVRGPWNDPYLTHVCAFPNPKVHDDDVDAGSLAHDRLKNRKHAPMSA
jgi:predicted phage terminase large subunit-like protein